MNGYVFTKTLGVIVGTLTIIGAIGFGNDNIASVWFNH